jgi:hypothetical protein
MKMFKNEPMSGLGKNEKYDDLLKWHKDTSIIIHEQRKKSNYDGIHKQHGSIEDPIVIL